MLTALIVTYFGGLTSADSIRPLFLIQFIFGVALFAFEATQLQNVVLPRTEFKTGVLRHYFSIFKESPVVKLHLYRDVIYTFVNQMRQPFTSILLVELKGADQFILGWRGTANMAITILFSLPGALLANRFGRTKLAYYTRVFHWLGLLTIILIPPTWSQFLILESIFESFFLAMFNGWTAFRQESIPVSVRGRWMGANMLLNGMLGTIAPIIGGVLWDLNPLYLWWVSLLVDIFVVLPIMIQAGRKAHEAHTKKETT
jgi:MFS family permease